MQHFYFDHNATTPVAPEVLETVVSCLGQVYGNASSIHHFGQAAKQRLEAARRQVAALIHASRGGIVFTSGGTEADNLAMLGVAPRRRPPRAHVITSAIEHPAVLAACAQLERGGRGGDAPARGPERSCESRRRARARCGRRPCWSRIMHANNELGTVQPIAEIARIAREAGVPLHVDGVQALGKIPVDVEALGVDLYSMSGHKLYAPKGVGALYVRKGTRLAPIAFGGHHERDRRPGTENVPGIAAFGAAAELAGRTPGGGSERLGVLRDRLENARARPHSRHRHQRRALESHAQHQQHLLRRHRRRGHGDRARPARLRGLDRRGLLQRRAHAVARADGDRTCATTARAPACASRWAARTPPSRWTRWWKRWRRRVAHLRRISRACLSNSPSPSP